MDFLCQLAPAVIPSCIGPVLKNIAYPFKVSDNVKALDVAVSTLMAAQDDVKNRVEIAELQGLKQTNQVEDWLGRVEAVKGEVDEIKKRYHERTRCLGTQSINCCSNFSISRDATKKLTEVQELREEGGKFTEVAIQIRPEVPELPVGSDVVVPKEEANFQEILRYVDSDQNGIFGIWGMGGAGKTRLLHLVNNHYKGSSAFDVVVKVTASKECSVEKLQAELCEKGGFGRGTSVESQAGIISNYLIKRNFLILLDDLWGQIKLEKVGIPIGLGNQLKQKVVITTRSSRVCGLMAVKKSLKVDGLDHEHALRLFKENVGDETINSHPLIPSLAAKVVNELGGLPLALITIGQSMSDKRYPVEWNHAIDRLVKFGLNEFDEEIKIFHKLKLSYDSLNTEKLKDCFLVCSLWPEDYIIEKIDLIKCWLGLGLLDLDIYDARNIYNPGYDVIGKLLSASLLEEVGLEEVKMHDVIRDMALWIAHDEGKDKDKWVVINGRIRNQSWHENISWPHVERFSLIYPHRLLISTPNQSIPCYTKRLQFLRISYLDDFSLDTITGQIVLKKFPGLVQMLVQNLKYFYDLTFLDLRNCDLTSFPQGISTLVNLKYLDLSNNSITSVPEELKLVRNLRYLSLKSNPIIWFPKGVLSELKELLVLNLGCFGNGGGGDYLTWLIKELAYLGSMRCLSIALMHPTHYLNLLELTNLPVRSLELKYENENDTLEIPSSFIGNSKVQNNLYKLHLLVSSVRKIVIESYDQKDQLGNLEFLKFAYMTMLEMIEWPRNIAPEDLLPILHHLTFVGCNRLRDFSWILYLPCLRTLLIFNCENIVQLIEHVGISSGTIKSTFPSLVKLSLDDLPNLQIFCDQSITFPSLVILSVMHCPKLKKLPFLSNTVPSKLRIIDITEKCWEQLEWEDNNLKQDLQPLVNYKDENACSIM